MRRWRKAWKTDGKTQGLIGNQLDTAQFTVQYVEVLMDILHGIRSTGEVCHIGDRFQRAICRRMFFNFCVVDFESCGDSSNFNYANLIGSIRSSYSFAKL